MRQNLIKNGYSYSKGESRHEGNPLLSALRCSSDFEMECALEPGRTSSHEPNVKFSRML